MEYLALALVASNLATRLSISLTLTKVVPTGITVIRLQEPTGMYGAIIIDPKEPDPVSYDRDHVVMLSDWSDEDPTLSIKD